VGDGNVCRRRCRTTAGAVCSAVPKDDSVRKANEACPSNTSINFAIIQRKDPVDIAADDEPRRRRRRLMLLLLADGEAATPLLMIEVVIMMNNMELKILRAM
jgi:hypothetical protein